MQINPVFVNELRQSAFRRRWPALGAALVFGGLLLSMAAQYYSLRIVIVSVPIVLIPLIVPAIASGAFAKEYEQQTWMDLYLTRLTNAQVVGGKFGAYVVQVAVPLIALGPPLTLLLLAGYSRRLSELEFGFVPISWQVLAVFTTVVFLVKLLISACLYILLAMVCSRYSPNRRTALTWSYVAIGLYSGMSWIVWAMLGSLESMNQTAADIAAIRRSVSIELSFPGFMESFHLIFCGVVGIGSAFLIWVSLGEQRGYRKVQGGDSVTRSWQPVVRSTKHRAT